MFSEFIDPNFVIDDAETLRPYECDGLSVYCEMPLLVLLPETIAQVQRVMSICHQYHIPIVARGAGTGLSAGAMPNIDGVVLSLAKFNKNTRNRCFSTYRKAAARGKKPGDQRSSQRIRAVLCARSILANCLYHWWQYCRKLRRCSLP